MEFEVTVDEYVSESETGGIQNETLDEAMAVPFTILSRQEFGWKHPDDDVVSVTYRIDVEPVEIAERIEAPQGSLFNLDDRLAIDTHGLVGSSHYQFEGEVYGKAGYQGELEGYVLRNVAFEELSYFNFVIPAHSDPEDDRRDTWLGFVAETSVVEYVAAAGSVRQFIKAVETGGVEAEVLWRGYS